jgi:hypothetical protein
MLQHAVDKRRAGTGCPEKTTERDGERRLTAVNRQRVDDVRVAAEVRTKSGR